MRHQKIYTSLPKKRGFTLIEILIGLGVIAVLSILAFFIYNKVKMQNQTHQTVTQIQSIVAGTQNSIFQHHLGHPGQNVNQLLIDTHIVPESMITHQGNIINAMGQPVTLMVANKANLLEIKYPQVPTAICLQLANQMMSNLYILNIDGVNMPKSSSSSNLQNHIIQKCSGQNHVDMVFIAKI